MTKAEQQSAITQLMGKDADWLNDLNACHEFEGKLSPLDHQKFCLFLHKQIMGTMDDFDINGTCNLECISRVVKAIAAQRCEAFCRMMWPERFKV